MEDRQNQSFLGYLAPNYDSPVFIRQVTVLP